MFLIKLFSEIFFLFKEQYGHTGRFETVILPIHDYTNPELHWKNLPPYDKYQY